MRLTDPAEQGCPPLDGIRLDSVGMVFPDGTAALSDVSLAVGRGEFVSLVGPSGCGKSTLLRIAARLLAPTSGTVESCSDHIGYVFQDPTLLPWRTVAKNVQLFAELHGMPAETRRSLAAAAVELVGLSGFEDHYPRSLSGGMKMRVSLARSFTLRPPVLLFDEPFGAVDEVTRHRLNEETQALFLSEGFAGLFVTHSISEAVFMSTKVYVMSARPGEIVAGFDVPFGYPRRHRLRFEPEFAELSSGVSRALRDSCL